MKAHVCFQGPSLLCRPALASTSPQLLRHAHTCTVRRYPQVLRASGRPRASRGAVPVPADAPRPRRRRCDVHPPPPRRTHARHCPRAPRQRAPPHRRRTVRRRGAVLACGVAVVFDSLFRLCTRWRRRQRRRIVVRDPSLLTSAVSAIASTTFPAWPRSRSRGQRSHRGGAFAAETRRRAPGGRIARVFPRRRRRHVRYLNSVVSAVVFPSSRRQRRRRNQTGCVHHRDRCRRHSRYRGRSLSGRH